MVWAGLWPSWACHGLDMGCSLSGLSCEWAGHLLCWQELGWIWDGLGIGCFWHGLVMCCAGHGMGWALAFLSLSWAGHGMFIVWAEL
jgi:hypothetical protein